jgi:site-specific recombinase XerD
VNDRLPADVLTRDEVERLLRACGRSRTGRRHAALIVLLWRSGLRISEALDLVPGDVDLERGTVRIRRGKGGASRTVAIDPGAAAIVERWMEVRPRSGYLLSTLDGERVFPESVRTTLRRLARKAGIDKRVHPHGLRHQFAIELIEEGADVTMVRDLLGHASLNTTDQYLRRLGTGRAIDFARSREWKPG